MSMLADVTFSTEGMVVIGALMTALTGAVVFLFKVLLAALQAQVASYKQIAGEAVSDMATLAEESRRAKGGPTVTPLASVVGEHSSPMTPEQASVADLQTMRAKLVAAKLSLGLPARGASETGDAAPSMRDDIQVIKEDVQEIKQATVDAEHGAEGAK